MKGWRKILLLFFWKISRHLNILKNVIESTKLIFPCFLWFLTFAHAFHSFTHLTQFTSLHFTFMFIMIYKHVRCMFIHILLFYVFILYIICYTYLYTYMNVRLFFVVWSEWNVCFYTQKKRFFLYSSFFVWDFSHLIQLNHSLFE